MKKQITFLLLAFLPTLLFAQKSNDDYRQSFKGKKVVIMSGGSTLIVEGTDGDEVIITSDKKESKIVPEAEGLKLLTPGMVDNTGVGASAKIVGDELLISVPKSKYFNSFKILVPKAIDISVSENGNPYGNWKITNMIGEVETNTTYSKLEISDVSGPIVAHGGYGKIYITYNKLNPDRPNFISSSGPIDVTLPADSKATLKLQSSYADVFTDFDITQIDAPNKKSDKENCNCDENDELVGYINNNATAKTLSSSLDNKIKWFTAENGEKYVVNKNDVYDKYAKKLSAEEIKKIKADEFLKANSDGEESNINLTSTSSSINRSSNINNNERRAALNGSFSIRGNNSWTNNNNTTYGTINNGGVQITIMSSNGNIYLRKKK